MSRDQTARATEDLESLASDAEDLMEDTGHVASAKVKEARERLLAAIASARETCQRLEEKAVAGAKATDRVIRSHPYESMGIAFGLGIIVGLLLRRK